MSAADVIYMYGVQVSFNWKKVFGHLSVNIITSNPQSNMKQPNNFINS